VSQTRTKNRKQNTMIFAIYCRLISLTIHMHPLNFM